jgi:antitoxin component YwqK of YwqJK toxin-antitoxin module
MKRLILLFTLILSFSCFSQELFNKDFNKVDPDGRRQGHWKVYDVNGALKFEGNFKDNVPVGEFKYYYPNGKTKAISHFFNDGRDSRTRVFSQQGYLMAEGKYSDRKKDSVWLYYSDFDGVLLSEEVYENTVPHGLWKTYYDNGNLAEEITYARGEKHGPWKQYFTDGSVKLKANYVEGKLEGLMVVFHLNGQVNLSGNYIHNFKDGTWMYFNDHAETVRKEVYDRGTLISTEEYETMYK